MEYTVERVLAMFKMAKNARTGMEPRFDDAFRLSMPGRNSFFGSDVEDQIDDVFDETAVVGVQEFASRLQSGITPNFSRWAELKAGSDAPEDQRDAINEQLQEITQVVFDTLNYSNFATESYESYLDLAVTTGCMEIEKGTAVEPVRFSAAPISEMYINNGPFDRIDQFFRARRYTWDQFHIKYPDHKFPSDEIEAFKEAVEPFKFIEATYQDWSDPNAVRYQRRLIWLGETNQFVLERNYEGVGSCPIYAFRWSKESGSVWGRGPMLNALPAVKTCNLVVQMILENAQMAIAGMYNMDDDNTINPGTITLAPGTIFPRSPGSKGLEPVQPAGDFNVAELVLNDMRTNIKKALYNDMLGNPNRTPMSATEVAERMADLSRQIGAAFGRLIFEFIIPTIQGVVYVLKELGLIELPTINNREIVVQATSPLAQAQAQTDIQAVDRLAEWLGLRFGAESVQMMMKPMETGQYVADKLQVPKNLLNAGQEEGGAKAVPPEAAAGLEQILGQLGQGGTPDPSAALPQAVSGGPIV